MIKLQEVTFIIAQGKLPAGRILSSKFPVRTMAQHFFKNHFNIILSLAHGYPV
jgi:hypothetical protein